MIKKNEEWVEWHEQQLRGALQQRDDHREQHAKLRHAQAQDEHDLRETEDAISKKKNVRCLYNNLHIPCSPADVTTAQALYITAFLEQYKLLQAQPIAARCNDQMAEALRAAAALTGQPLDTGVPGERAIDIDYRYGYEPIDDADDPDLLPNAPTTPTAVATESQAFNATTALQDEAATAADIATTDVSPFAQAAVSEQANLEAYAAAATDVPGTMSAESALKREQPTPSEASTGTIKKPRKPVV